MVRIYFPFNQAGGEVLPIAAACGVGEFPKLSGGGYNRFSGLGRRAHEFFCSSSLEKANLVVYPHPYKDCDETRRSAQLAKENGLPCVFMRGGDDASPTAIQYGTIYKESLFASTRSANEELLPPFIADPLGGDPWSLPWSKRSHGAPTVGFCGYVGSPLVLPLYLAAGRREKLTGLLLRRRAIKLLAASSMVTTRFILRTKYWGGAVRLTERRLRLLANHMLGVCESADTKWDAARERLVYREFLDNLFESDYNLCVRGAGNFSYRFYEVLAAGRIPLFVNSDCVLPFAHLINWREHCVWVEASSLSTIADSLLQFHSTRTADELRKIQLANRQIYEEYLTPLNFYKRIFDQALET